MKSLITILLLLPCRLFAQDITGIWTGTLSTSEKKLPYEVIISDSSGTLIGYSHITFTVRGQEIIAVKRLNVTSDDGQITLEDEDMITDNIPDANAKHIKQIAKLVLDKEDSSTFLVGTFRLKKTNDLKPISGYISLQKKRLSDTSKLMAKLEDLGMTNSLSFLQLKKQTDKIALPIGDTKPKPVDVDNNLVAQNVLPVAPPVLIKKTTATVAPKDTQLVAIKHPVVKPAIESKPKEIKTVATAPVKVIKTQPIIKPVVKQVVNNQPVIAVQPLVQKAVVVAPVVHVNHFDANTTGAAADIAHREIQNIQTLYITCDSIVVTLYDNGEVDGDTVSILLNGKVIMPKEGLSTHPITKTVYVTPDLGDSLQFVMYAENLGSIPPNTGLMILQDGKIRHEIFFSGDLEKNAAITLRRRHDTN